MFTGKTQTLIVASSIAVIMLSVRIIQSSSPIYIFLAWNLLLAWVPYISSFGLPEKNNRRKWATGLLLATWLLFLPNAPYLVTDFIHLQQRPGIPLLYDVVMLFLFSFTGLALGLLSIQRTEQWFARFHSPMIITLLRMAVFLLCGFGIYLGRVERWNSWDVLYNPVELANGILDKITNPVANRYAWGTTLLFALLIWVPYAILKTIPATDKKHS